MKENNEKFHRTWNKEKLKYGEFQINKNKRNRIYTRNYKRIWDCLETFLFVIYPSCLRPFFGSIPLKTLLDLSARTEKVKRDPESRRLEHTLLSSEARWVRVLRGDGGEGRRQQKKFDKLDAAEGWLSRDVCSPSFGSWLYSNTVVHHGSSQGRYRVKTIILTSH